MVAGAFRFMPTCTALIRQRLKIEAVLVHMGLPVRVREGWCSTAKKAAKERKRFLTKLVNIKTGETGILGMGVKAFARAHGLCYHELSKLVNRRKIFYRYWVLEQTHKALQAGTRNIHIGENIL